MEGFNLANITDVYVGDTQVSAIYKGEDAVWEAIPPIDLSMVDNAGNVRQSMTTANCYLVHQEGTYKIPLVYGNAIKNGQDNRVAYYPGENNSITNGLDQFVNHNGDGITGPWITKNGTGVDAGMNVTVDSAQLLWLDAQNLITKVKIDGDYLVFKVGTFAVGNALIAVKSGSTVVWSWHIWATEDDLSNTSVLNTGAHSYTVSPTVLGWVPTPDNGRGYAPYYMRGKHSPLKPNHTVYNISNSSTTAWQQVKYSYPNTAYIKEYIKNPTGHIYPSGVVDQVDQYSNIWDALCSAKYTGANDNNTNVSTPAIKTIYDPCPPDFCLPTGNMGRYIAGGQKSSNGIYNRTATSEHYSSGQKGFTWATNVTGDPLFFPFGGSRNYEGTISYDTSRAYFLEANKSNLGIVVNAPNTLWTWSPSTTYASELFVLPVAEE